MLCISSAVMAYHLVARRCVSSNDYCKAVITAWSAWCLAADWAQPNSFLHNARDITLPMDLPSFTRPRRHIQSSCCTRLLAPRLRQCAAGWPATHDTHTIAVGHQHRCTPCRLSSTARSCNGDHHGSSLASG